MLSLKIEQDPYPEEPSNDGELWLCASVSGSIEVGMERRLTSSQARRLHWIFPVYGYKHSGFSMSLSRGWPYDCPWDSGIAGEIFARKKTWPDMAEAYKAAEALVLEWNQYLSGDVWTVVVEDSDGVPVDSCGGYYGREYAEQAGADMLALALADRARQAELISRGWAE